MTHETQPQNGDASIKLDAISLQVIEITVSRLNGVERSKHVLQELIEQQPKLTQAISNGVSPLLQTATVLMSELFSCDVVINRGDKNFPSDQTINQEPLMPGLVAAKQGESIRKDGAGQIFLPIIGKNDNSSQPLGSVAIDWSSTGTKPDIDVLAHYLDLLASYITTAASVQMSKLIANPEVLDLYIRDPEASALKNYHASILFADLEGFTTFSTIEPPEEVANFLSQFYSIMASSFKNNFGISDKFQGDGAMGIFNAPIELKSPASSSVKAALSIINQMQSLKLARGQEGKTTPRLRLGVHFGEVEVGFVGSDDRQDFTAIGKNVNHASRTQSNAMPDHVTVTQEVIDQCEKEDFPLVVSPFTTTTFKGESESTNLYLVTGFMQSEPTSRPQGRP